MLTVFMWYFRTRGEGRDLSTAGRSFANKLYSRGELSCLAPLGSENISAPYFKQCFFGGGGITPPD